MMPILLPAAAGNSAALRVGRFAGSTRIAVPTVGIALLPLSVVAATARTAA
jgi:hypothetical protein